MLILAGMVTVAVPLALVVAHFVPHLTVQAQAVTAMAQPHKHGHEAPAGHRPGQAPDTGIPAAPDSPVRPGPAGGQPAAARRRTVPRECAAVHPRHRNPRPRAQQPADGPLTGTTSDGARQLQQQTPGVEPSRLAT